MAKQSSGVYGPVKPSSSGGQNSGGSNNGFNSSNYQNAMQTSPMQNKPSTSSGYNPKAIYGNKAPTVRQYIRDQMDIAARKAGKDYIVPGYNYSSGARGQALIDINAWSTMADHVTSGVRDTELTHQYLEEANARARDQSPKRFDEDTRSSWLAMANDLSLKLYNDFKAELTDLDTADKNNRRMKTDAENMTRAATADLIKAGYLDVNGSLIDGVNVNDDKYKRGSNRQNFWRNRVKNIDADLAANEARRADIMSKFVDYLATPEEREALEAYKKNDYGDPRRLILGDAGGRPDFLPDRKDKVEGNGRDKAADYALIQGLYNRLGMEVPPLNDQEIWASEIGGRIEHFAGALVSAASTSEANANRAADVVLGNEKATGWDVAYNVLNGGHSVLQGLGAKARDKLTGAGEQRQIGALNSPADGEIDKLWEAYNKAPVSWEHGEKDQILDTLMAGASAWTKNAESMQAQYDKNAARIEEIAKMTDVSDPAMIAKLDRETQELGRLNHQLEKDIKDARVIADKYTGNSPNYWWALRSGTAEDRAAAIQQLAWKLDNEGAKNFSAAEAASGPIQRKVLQTAGTITEIGFDAAVAAITKTDPRFVMGLRVLGSSRNEGLKRGWSEPKAALFGYANATAEIAAEGMGELAGGVIYGESAAGEFVGELARRLTDNPAFRKWIMKGGSVFGEGAEEGATDFAAIPIEMIFDYNKDQSFWENLKGKSAQELATIWEDMLMGSLVALLGIPVGDITGSYNQQVADTYAADLMQDEAAHQQIINDATSKIREAARGNVNPIVSVTQSANAGGTRELTKKNLQETTKTAEEEAITKLAERSESDTSITKAANKYRNIINKYGVTDESGNIIGLKTIPEDERLTKQESDMLSASGLLPKEVKAMFTGATEKEKRKAARAAGESRNISDITRDKIIERAEKLDVGQKEAAPRPLESRTEEAPEHEPGAGGSREYEAELAAKAAEGKKAINEGETDNQSLAKVVSTVDAVISSSKTVKAINENVFKKTGEEGEPSLADKVSNWMEKTIGGRIFTKKIGGENGTNVILDKRGITSNVNEENAAIFQTVPDVLRNGHIVSTAKENGEPVSYIIAGKVNLMGKPVNVYCVVEKDGEGFRLREVSDGSGNSLYQPKNNTKQNASQNEPAEQVGNWKNLTSGEVAAIDEAVSDGVKYVYNGAMEHGREVTITYDPNAQTMTVKGDGINATYEDITPDEFKRYIDERAQEGVNENEEVAERDEGDNSPGLQGDGTTQADIRGEDGDAELVRRAPKQVQDGDKQTRRAWINSAKFIEKNNGRILSGEEISPVLKQIADTYSELTGRPVTFYDNSAAGLGSGFTNTNRGNAGLFIGVNHPRVNHPGTIIFHEDGHQSWDENGKGISRKETVLKALAEAKVSQDDVMLFEMPMLKAYGLEYFRQLRSMHDGSPTYMVLDGKPIRTQKQWNSLNAVEQAVALDSLPDDLRDDIVEHLYEEMSNWIMTNDQTWIGSLGSFGNAPAAMRKALVGAGIYTQAKMDAMIAAAEQLDAEYKSAPNPSVRRITPEDVKPIDEFDGKMGLTLYAFENPDTHEKTVNALRNVSMKHLIAMLKEGGEAMPSIAITLPSHGHEWDGDATIVYGRETIDRTFDKRNRVYGADAWTPSFPPVKNSSNFKNQVIDLLVATRDAAKSFGVLKSDFYRSDADYRKSLSNGYWLPSDPEEALSALSETAHIKAAILKEAGISPDELLNDLPKDKKVEVEIMDAIDRTFGDVDGDIEFPGGVYVPMVSLEYSQDDGGYETINLNAGKDAREILKGSDAVQGIIDFISDDIIESLGYDPFAGLSNEESLNLISNAIQLLAETRDSGGRLYNKLVKDAIPDQLALEWLKQKVDTRTSRSLIGDKGKELPFSLENALTLMQEETSRREVNHDSGYELRSLVTPSFRSFEEMKAHEYMLTPQKNHGLYKAQYDEATNAVDQAINMMSDVLNISHHKADYFLTSIAKKYQETIDNIEERIYSDEELREILDKIIADRFSLEEYNPAVDGVYEAIYNAFDKLANLPTGYFEAKPQRVVGLDEIKAIIVPYQEITEELRQLAGNAGIRIIPYSNYETPLIRQSEIDSTEQTIQYYEQMVEELEDNGVIYDKSHLGPLMDADEIFDENGFPAGYKVADEDVPILISSFSQQIDKYKDDLKRYNEIKNLKSRPDVVKEDIVDQRFALENPLQDSDLDQLKAENEDLKRQLADLKGKQPMNTRRDVQPGGTRKAHNPNALEQKTQSYGSRVEHYTRMDKIAEKFGTDDGTFLSKTREEVSRIADYCIEEFGAEPERERLMNTKDWTRLDFSIAGKIAYDMTVKLNDEMTALGNKGLGKNLERKDGESWNDYQRRQAEEDKREFLRRREPIDALLQMYEQQKSEAGQKLQEQYKFSTADEIRMKASQRLLSYTVDGEVTNASDKAKNAKIYAIISDLLNRAEAADTKGDMKEMAEIAKLTAQIRGRENLFGKAGMKAENAIFDDLLKAGVEPDKMAALTYGNIKKILDDLTPITYMDALNTIRMSNMLSNVATGVNNFKNNAVALRLGALAQNAAYPFAKAFEKITGKKVAFTDTSFTRIGGGKMRAEITAYEYALLSAYYGINQEQGRFDVRSANAGFNINGEGIGGVMGRNLARYNFLINALVLSPDAPAKARAEHAMRQGIERAFEGVDMTKEMAANKKELEAFAHNETLRRTLQDDNRLTNDVMWVKKRLNKHETRGKDLVINGRQLGSIKLGDFAMAFAKVPANVGYQKVMATPFGAAYQMLRYADGLARARMNPESMSTIEMAKLSRDIGRAATTWGMIALGALGAMTGALKNFDDTDDDEEKKLAAEKGYRGLTFNVNALFRKGNEWKENDKVISGSFLEILAMPLAIGAIMYDASQEGIKGPKLLWKGTVDGFSGMVDAVMDIPGLQQFSQIYEAYANNRNPDEDLFTKGAKAVGQFVVNSGTSYVIPNIVSQVGAGLDNKQRDVYGVDTYPETLRNIVMSKIPGVRTLLPEKTDTFGNTRTYGDNQLMALINTVLLPGDIKKYHISDLETEMLRLKEATGYKGTIFDTKAPKSIKFDDEEYALDADNGRAYHDAKAKCLLEAYDKFRNSDVYDKLTDDQKLAVVMQLRTDADRITRNGALKLAGVDEKKLNDSLEKWERELKTWDEKIDFLSTKQMVEGIWDKDKNTIGDYAAMDKFIKEQYPSLSKTQKDLLDNTYSRIDDIYSASKVGIDAKTYAQLDEVHSKYEDMQDYYRDVELDDEPSQTALARNMIVDFEDIVKDPKQRAWAQENMKLWMHIPVNTETLEKWQEKTSLETKEIDSWYDVKEAAPVKGGYKELSQNQRLQMIRDFTGITASSQSELEKKRWEMVEQEASHGDDKDGDGEGDGGAWAKLKSYRDAGYSVAYALDHAVYWYTSDYGKHWQKRSYNKIYPSDK